MPVQDLVVAVLDPVRDPGRYGGELDYVEQRWQQLGAWVAEVGMPDDACHHLVRAVARTARDVTGEEWDSASSSGWAALQLWMQAHLDAGAQQVRGVFPEPGASHGQPPVHAVQGAAMGSYAVHFAQATREPLQQARHRPAVAPTQRSGHND